MKDFDIPKYLKSLNNVTVDDKIDPELSVFKTKVNDNDKIFALIYKKSNPLKITLKCDRQLAKKLRDEYETVMPATKMNKNYWNNIICSGQLSTEDIKDLINLSYHLVQSDD